MAGDGDNVHGFLSLDCGASESHTDEIGIQWTPDGKYIKTGVEASVSSTLGRGLSPIYQRLRYFPDTSRKHCYGLPVLVDEVYLVRPRFYYGNYDGLESSLREFEILIGANKVTDTHITKGETWYHEFVVKAANSTLDFCLASNSTSPANVPFISAIELRRLELSMSGNLSDSNEAIVVWRRINLGATSDADIRFPEDPYDRMWQADTKITSLEKYQRISTNSTVSASTFDRPPSAVMRTAITSDSAIVFTFPAKLRTSLYKVNFYFAEFANLGNNTRQFTIFFNTSMFQDSPLIIDTGKPDTLTSMQIYLKYPVELSHPTQFLFTPTRNSTLGPIINAAELLEFKNLLPGTESDDGKRSAAEKKHIFSYLNTFLFLSFTVLAIREVMNHFNLTGWSGDPCLPHRYTWSWITCDFAQSPAIITELKLSNQRLNATIPESIRKLSHLTKIYLDNNVLTGRVPTFSSLKNLTVLSLQNNSLECIPPELQFSFNITANLCEKHNKKKNTTLIIAVAVPSVAILLLGAGLVVFFFSSKKRDSPRTVRAQDEETTENSKPKSPNFSAKSFTYKDIINTTNNFKKVLGEGSFGPVYYGRLPDGTEVAVKVLSSSSSQGHQEFYTEIDILSIVHHRNLVTFLGYCNQGSELILVYELLANGTLREHLYGTNRPTLSWKTRLQIALEAAQALEYLHTSCNVHIIHRDIKTTNILLNFAMVAKVSDFGISKLYNKNEASHVSTAVKGTPGYLDPEYHSYNRLTEKSDVYSFGVVLFEIASGREPINLSLPEEQIVLSTWACKELEKGNLKAVIDPKLSNYREQSAWKLLEVAMRCVEHSSKRRPNMSMVVTELREAIQLEEDGSFSSRQNFNNGI
ncbi:probable LRR receptor-like serine/threonine-protein kinase At1g67720 [Selaginella moellendorffii]|uniref:probable LRR receptor-like serine/threonine-protein kinase At1g67720 n=1 Tax=Selaginella moellendorffii TaxID=88036 RepID=UPI000D1C7129|nr:probable LRR receptor-like serine/threonine-protein kinase At1g67720 [Selaginella moellendorffii]|eukprot:XP_024515517.1 probable LRR receptor-like serine/threonine-protein kinase At1g67720 [Selaginella moellendorffii]